jgi:phage protein D/phage baseplate assembly protein gpV
VAYQQTAGQLKVDVDGQPLPSDVEQMVDSILVETNLHTPDRFSVTFRDNNREVLGKAGVKVGSKVSITAYSNATSTAKKLVSGEVTVLEVDHDSTGTFTVVGGYDVSHRLFRGSQSTTFKDVTYGDIVRRVGQRAGLTVGDVSPGGSTHEVVNQANQSDWAFLHRLAREVGYVINVVDGKLTFAPPPDASAGPGSGNLESSTPLELTVGAHLLSLRAVVTSANQVSGVEVRGWDPTQKKAVVSTADAATTSASLSLSPSQVASIFNAQTMSGTGTPYSRQSDTDAAAKALAEQVAGGFAEIDATARGNPALRAGKAVSISLAGDPFDGKYVLTSSTHRYDPHEGYTTEFAVSGANPRSLLELTQSDGRSRQIPGVVPALVTDVNDPDQQARVQLKFPWLSDTYTTDWVRTVQSGAGKDRGSVFLPEVNDEVLVAFDRGDWRQPYVIGGLYNGVDTPKLGDGLIDGTSGSVKRRGMVSKNGHMLVFFDDSGKDGIALLTAGGNLKVSLNNGQSTVKISSSGQINIEGNSDVSVKSSGNLSLEATGQLTLKGATVGIQADSSVTVSGPSISLGGG